MHQEATDRLDRLEREQARLKRRVSVQNWLLAGLAAVALSAGAFAGVQPGVGRFDRVVAKDITVVDAGGIVRARMTADAPDAVMAGGHVSKRGTKAAGFLIYDEQGIERGGYVTMDVGSNAMLSLDSKHRMLANMIAGPEESGTSVLNLRGGDKRQLELRVDSDGGRMSASAGGRVELQLPEILKLAPETCSHWKDLDARYPDENVCRSRFGEAACKACTGHP